MTNDQAWLDLIDTGVIVAPRYKRGRECRWDSVEIAVAAALLTTAPAALAATPDGLLFRASADAGTTADVAGGDPAANFQSNVAIVADGRTGSAFQWADDGYLAWRAPGNIYAQRGTLSFFWRSRTPVGEAPFVIFRVGFADQPAGTWRSCGSTGTATASTPSSPTPIWRAMRVSFTHRRAARPEPGGTSPSPGTRAVGVRLYVDGKRSRAQGPHGRSRQRARPVRARRPDHLAAPGAEPLQLHARRRRRRDPRLRPDARRRPRVAALAANGGAGRRTPPRRRRARRGCTATASTRASPPC